MPNASIIQVFILLVFALHMVVIMQYTKPMTEVYNTINPTI